MPASCPPRTIWNRDFMKEYDVAPIPSTCDSACTPTPADRIPAASVCDGGRILNPLSARSRSSRHGDGRGATLMGNRCRQRSVLLHHDLAGYEARASDIPHRTCVPRHARCVISPMRRRASAIWHLRRGRRDRQRDHNATGVRVRITRSRWKVDRRLPPSPYRHAHGSGPPRAKASAP